MICEEKANSEAHKQGVVDPMTIEEMRKNYAKSGLDEKDIDLDPMVQFESWFEQANQSDLPDWMEVNAMTLSTSDGAGGLTSRVVLLKGIEDGKFFFYTNYDSAKANQMAASPSVALCFFWPHLQRQVRIVGTVSKTDRQRSEKYFASRPRGSQLGAHVSKQSSLVDDRSDLESRMAALQEHYDGVDVPCPENWGGYEVTPTEFEFWQGRPSRLHDRICYRIQGEAWAVVRLSP